MNEDIIIDTLIKNGVEFVASLPCDKNKKLTSLLEKSFHFINLAREEDGVGICTGLSLTGKRAVVSIQSSGIGNMLNALMSLGCLYHIPIPILASWRGVQNEAICAQIPFNKPLPELLKIYGIPYRIFSDISELQNLNEIISLAYEKKTPVVALLLPSCWENEDMPEILYPVRDIQERTINLSKIGEPVIKRAEAIASVVHAVPSDSLIISNIGVPSKELYAVSHRSGNFYMLGSYTQASAIGLGCALGCPDRDVFVLDGDGSLLGSAVLPVIAAEKLSNLHIIALDNGTFGSTGNQISPAYNVADIGLLALAAGITDVISVRTVDEIINAINIRKTFVQVIIKPGNSNVKNIDLSPEEIKEQFTKFLNTDLQE